MKSHYLVRSGWRFIRGDAEQALAVEILDQGRGRDWDGSVIDALKAALPVAMSRIYGASATRREADARDEPDQMAA